MSKYQAEAREEIESQTFDGYHNPIIFGVYLFKKILIPQAHNLLSRLTAQKERVVRNIKEVMPVIVNNIKRWVTNSGDRCQYIGANPELLVGFVRQRLSSM